MYIGTYIYHGTDIIVQFIFKQHNKEMSCAVATSVLTFVTIPYSHLEKKTENNNVKQKRTTSSYLGMLGIFLFAM